MQQVPYLISCHLYWAAQNCFQNWRRTSGTPLPQAFNKKKTNFFLFVRETPYHHSLAVVTIYHYNLHELFYAHLCNQHHYYNHCHRTAGYTKGMSLLLSRRKSFMPDHAPSSIVQSKSALSSLFTSCYKFKIVRSGIVENMIINDQSFRTLKVLGILGYQDICVNA